MKSQIEAADTLGSLEGISKGTSHLLFAFAVTEAAGNWAAFALLLAAEVICVEVIDWLGWRFMAGLPDNAQADTECPPENASPRKEDTLSDLRLTKGAAIGFFLVMCAATALIWQRAESRLATAFFASQLAVLMYYITDDLIIAEEWRREDEEKGGRSR